MARRMVQAQGIEYVFSADDEAPLSSRIWGIVQARVINDVTGEPVESAVRIESDLEPCIPRVCRDGLVGLAAIPRRLFPALAGNNYTMSVTIHADGYLSRTQSLVIPRDQRNTVVPFPRRGDRVITMNDTARLRRGETLMVGNPVTDPGTRFEEVQIAALGPGPGQVTITPPLFHDHIGGSEPIVPVVPDNFASFNMGDVLMVPAP